MARESKPLPRSALTAAFLFQQQAQAAMESLAGDVLDDMGLPRKALDPNGWTVDFKTREVFRVVPDDPSTSPQE